MRFSKAILAALLFLPCVYPQARSNGVVSATMDNYAITGAAWFGDTPMSNAWTGPTNGGNFNGGRFYFALNDLYSNCGGRNLGFLELNKLDWSTQTNTTINCVNTMSSSCTGNQSGGNPCGTFSDGLSYKSWSPWAYNDDLYLPVFRVLSAGGGPALSTILVSTDKGVHWCNPNTYTTNSNSCPSNATTAAGDLPQGPSTGFMFGSDGVQTNNFARLINIQFCQNQTCTGMPFNADNYLYFLAVSADYGAVYPMCVAKNRTSILDATQWYFYTGGSANCSVASSWSHTSSNAVSINNLYGTGQYIGSVNSAFYLNGAFVTVGYSSETNGILATSSTPWGQYSRIAVGMTIGEFTGANLAFLDSSCSGCGTNPGRYDLTVMSDRKNLHNPAGSLYFYKLPLTIGGSAVPGLPPKRGIGALGMSALRISPSGNNKRIISKGLVYAVAADDWTDWGGPQNVYSAVQEVMGTTGCLLGGSNTGAAFLWGGVTRTLFGAGYITQDGAPGYSPFFASGGSGSTCTAAIPLTSNSAVTMQVVIYPSAISFGGDQRLFIELSDAAYTTYNGLQLVSGYGAVGSIDIGNASPGFAYVPAATATAAGWTANAWNILTVTMPASSIMNSTNAKVYINRTQAALTNVAGNVSNATFNNLFLRVGCWDAFANVNCQPGTNSAGKDFGASYALILIYDRVLSQDEITRNYYAIKSELARARSIVLP